MIEIILGDALEELPKLESDSFDAVITDPPYGSNHSWDKATMDFQETWIKEVTRILKPSGVFFSFFCSLKVHQFISIVEKYLNYRNLVVWSHPNLYGAYQSYGRDRFKLTWEAIIYAVKGKPTVEVAQKFHLFYGSGFDVITIPAITTQKLHKAEKPLKLIKLLVASVTEPGDKVLDPFAGSGTTGVACKMLNRDCLLIEKEQKFYEIAKERLEETVCLTPLF